MNSLCIYSAALLCCLSHSCFAADWPAYQHDVRRTGYSSEQVTVERLQLSWTWRSPSPPQPAWAGPAKWDAYAGHRDLPSMRSYDLCFQPIAVGGNVYFGSSSDDTLYCIDAANGNQNWSFTTDGPIRTAPSFSNGNLYFGSDDGFTYCLNAATGSQVWKFRPVKTKRRIVNNGRFIPMHPVRTGVLVDNGKAYFGCALLPWKDAYLCSVDALTGAPTGDGCFVKKLDGATLEGPPAATSDLLVFPQGRVAPRVFQRADGTDNGQLKKSSGGSIVVVSLDASVFHGPGADSRKGGINSTNLQTREVVATHGRGNAMVVTDNVSYMLTNEAIIASDLVKRKTLWTQSCDQPYALIGVGDVLFAGGRNEVVAYDAKDGHLVWQSRVDGKAYGLAAANGRLVVSTDTGTIHTFEMTDESQTASDTSDTDLHFNGQEEFKPAEFEQISDKALLGRWVFQKPYVTGKVVKDLAGNLDGQITGALRLGRAGDVQALHMDGSSHTVLLTDDHAKAKLPTKDITVEAWVRVDQPQTWGGIIGAVQDNGSYERGWILGFRESRFSFALTGKSGNVALTYLTAKEDFQEGHWYHVVGVYDGVKLQLFVDGNLANESTAQQGEINYPPKTFFEIGAYHDENENYRLNGQIHEVRLYNRALDSKEIAEHTRAKSKVLPAEPPATSVYTLAAGPWLQFTDPRSAIIRWRTKEAVPTLLEYSLDGKVTKSVDKSVKTDHQVALAELQRNRVYRYHIKGSQDCEAVATSEFEFDTFFNFTLPQVDPSASRSLNKITPSTNRRSHTELASKVQDILKLGKVDRGICVVLGCADPTFAIELARQSQLRIVAVEKNSQRVQESRERLKNAGVYGNRITVHHTDDFANLPFVGHSANLIVANPPLKKLGNCAAELYRMLRPDGGVACLELDGTSKGEAFRWWKESAPDSAPEVTASVKQFSIVRRSALIGAGEWSHLYGRADNSAFGGEELGGANSADDLEVQWIGRPGPRFKPDRNGRKPAPLSTGGRLFIQGLHRMAALDAYNGTVLWSLEIPGLERFNMPRDCGNWCADRDFVYAAIRDKCWQIDAATGEVVKIHDVIPGSTSSDGFDWGGVVSRDDQLIGTAVKTATSWTNFWGNADAGWYDARSGAVTDKICADNVFSIDKASGEKKWSYAKGVVINSTLTVHDNVIYFVESRNAEVVTAPQRRVGNPKLWEDQFLVALDAYTGAVIWERPIDTEDGKVVFYMAGGSYGRLVIVSSADKNYHVYGFATDQGEQSWHQTFHWPGGKGDHGKAMSRPAIVGDRVYVRPQAFRLADGKPLETQMPGGGCGTYACSSTALFFRASRVTMWNQASGKASGWDRLRPDCWLSAIPAAGMLLSAEGGGGCSCGTWMETSVGFMPTTHR